MRVSAVNHGEVVSGDDVREIVEGHRWGNLGRVTSEALARSIRNRERSTVTKTSRLALVSLRSGFAHVRGILVPKQRAR